jgi:hypothetical protein
MHDMLYTKAAVIHTWLGCFIRVFSWLATVVSCALLLSHFKSASYNDPYSRIDVAVTCALLAGTFLLETASSLKAAGSTWTCQIFHSRGWHDLHRMALSIRRFVNAAECSRRWPSYIPQVEVARRDCGLPYEFFDRFVPFRPVIGDIKLLVLKQIRNMVDGCSGNEEKLRKTRGEMSLRRNGLSNNKLMVEFIKNDFDTSILIWDSITLKFKKDYSKMKHSWCARRAMRLLSNYMTYLFKEQPHMLPSPVRHDLLERSGFIIIRKLPENLSDMAESIYKELVSKVPNMEQQLEVVLGVWVEMLCYAATYCNRDSHARELSNGSGQFATVVWVLRNQLFKARFGRLRLRDTPKMSTAAGQEEGTNQETAASRRTLEVTDRRRS